MESSISRYECELCNKNFSQKSSRNRHLKEKHLKPNKYHCEQCESRFSKKYNLQVHVERVHLKNWKQTKSSRSSRGFTKSDTQRCLESNTSLATSEHANEIDAQSVADSVLQELKQLQIDIQLLNVSKSKFVENMPETTKTATRTVQVTTVIDNLYPLKNFKLLKAQTTTRVDGMKYFVCDFCSKEIRKKYNFLRHRRIHTKLRPFVCVLCKSTFPTTAQLKMHGSIHKLHEKLGLFRKFYKCPRCDEGFCTIRQFDEHLSSSDCKIAFECPKCFKTFRSLKVLLRHKHSENDNELKMLKKILPDPLPLREQLRSHATKKHISVKIFKCHYCNKCFNRTQSCRRHMETHLKILLQTHESEKDAVALFSAIVENRKCEQTVKSTISIMRNKNTLKTKEEKTSGQLRYKCTECEKSFYYNSWLKKHFKYKHTNEFPFKCSSCYREFRTKQSLESHLLVHSTKRCKLTCQVCARQYASSKSLKVHQRIHTQEMPFSCKNCSRQFRTSGHLIQHCKSYHRKL